jgi:SprT protein
MSEQQPTRLSPQTRLEQWADLERRAREQTEALVRLGQRLTGRAIAQPPVRFDLRGQSAGQVRIDARGRGMIRYNAALLLRHGDDFLRQTVPHEVAHYVAYLHHGRAIRPHGPEWRQLVTALGGEPLRCHRYDIDGLRLRQTRWFLYHCRCGEHKLSSIRHNRISGGARYLCRRCGETLRAGSASSQSG